MENNNNFNQEQPANNNNNWNPGSNMYLPDVDGGSTSQILGIIGLVLTLCTGCSVVGLILSIIALVKGKNAVEMYEQNPGQYSAKSYSQAKAGKTMGIIGLVFGILALIGGIIYVLVMVATDGGRNF